MSSQEKSIRLFFLVSVLGVAVALADGSGQQSDERPMTGILDHMDRMMGQGDQMMGQMDVMTEQTGPGAKRTMDMKSMMARMGGISLSMKAMVDNLHTMMMDDGLIKDWVITEQSDQMQEHLRQMADAMHKSLENMKLMTERMAALQIKQ